MSLHLLEFSFRAQILNELKAKYVGTMSGLWGMSCLKLLMLLEGVALPVVTMVPAPAFQCPNKVKLPHASQRQSRGLVV